MKRSAFTMVELIFVIVIIGVLASIGIPKLSGVSDGAKKTAEIATISAVSTAIESAHGEWSINEGEFTWGNGMTYSPTNLTLNNFGYPRDLNKTDYTTSNQPFDGILKGDNSGFTRVRGPVTNNNANGRCTFSIFTGPASDQNIGVKASSIDIGGKPDKNDFWVYTSEVNCSNNTSVRFTDSVGKVTTFLSGDFLLIDMPNPGMANYAIINLTCN